MVAAAGSPERDARPTVAVLDQALWRDIAATDDAGFGEAWLGLTCRSITGAVAGVLVLEREAVAAWPAGLRPDAGLVAAALAAAEAKRGALQPVPGSEATRIAYPVMLDESAAGAVAFDVAQTATARDPRVAMRQLQWAVAWVRDHRRRQETAVLRQTANRTTLALDMLAAALEQERFTAAARVAATELAIRLGCERVAFGLRRRGSARVVSVSHSAQFGRQMRLVRHLEEAMDEALDQRAVVLHPAADAAPLLTRAHAALLEASGAAAVLTVPMLVKDRFVGAATFERAAGAPFDQATVDLAEAVVAILAPALIDKREIDRWLLQKAGSAVWRQAGMLLGPMHLGRKLAALAVVALLLAAQFAHGEYRIAADGRIEGRVQRAIVAPFDGFVSDASTKAGDTVAAGAVLVDLDDRDLQLERLRWTTERQAHSDEYDAALSQGKRAEAVRAQNLMAEADAQIKLADAQLARARVTAPFDGLVISGDLSQSIGAPVRRGDTLFELAPLNDYRVELSVPEQQIASVQQGQHGTLVVASLPDQSFGFIVERTTPVATPHDGRMVFRVDAKLDDASHRLRPGMEGVGKIDAGRARLAWIWTRSLLDWVRLTAWQWWP